MSEFIECQDCSFVLLCEPGANDPMPKGQRESCPDCGGSNFAFSGK